MGDQMMEKLDNNKKENEMYENLKIEFQNLINKESKTKEERKKINELSMKLNELKKIRKAEWKQNMLKGE